jgi:predicted dehydrogenase
VFREIAGVKLAAVADRSEQTAAKVGDTYAAPHYTSFETMLDEIKPDLVTLAVPTSLHFEIGKQLIERGVDVLIEKPITTTIAQGEELIELARSKGTVLAVGHIERFNPAVMELRRRLTEGMAGRIYQVHASRLSPYPTRIRDAGVVLDLASHDIDLMRYLVGGSITRLFGEVSQSINSDREDMFNGMMRFSDGTLGVFDVNWITPTKVRRLTITGARGMFRCDLLTQELYFYENEQAPSGWDQLSILRGVTEGNVIGLRIQRHEPLMEELKDFVDAVTKRRPPTVTGWDGVETLRIALDFMNSAASKSAVYRTAGGE